MVSMKKALKLLEPRRTRERKDDVPVSKLHIMDPSHELSLQQTRPATSHETSYAIHAIARHSNPELHTPKTKWSSASSVVSLDRDSVSLFNNEDIDDDIDMLQYDVSTKTFPTRRRSTGSSRQKSQQKLAKILGWNTNKQEGPRPCRSTENLSSPVSTIRSPLTLRSPVSWNTEITDPYSSEAGSYPSKNRRASSYRSNSIKSTSSRSNSTEPYDYQMRQFVGARAYDKDKARAREKVDSDVSLARSSAARSESPSSPGPTRRPSNPNVHKPLPMAPSFPSFPNVHPLSQTSLSSSSTPVSAIEDEDGSMMNLSAEEASVLLSRPEPFELPAESYIERAELPTPVSTPDPNPRIRSKSPTQPRSGSAASAVNDFGPGTTLSIIEEEPWSTEDLAAFKVWELPAGSLPTIVESSSVVQGSDTSCPGLSPSSSMSSRKMRSKDAELEDTLEESSAEGANAGVDADAEGEEIYVLYDERVPRPSQRPTLDMREKSFLSLEDDSEDDEATDTEESVRNSFRYSRASTRGWPLMDEMEDMSSRRNPHRASVETTKTAYTTSSERTVVNPDFSNDLAKRMDWF